MSRPTVYEALGGAPALLALAQAHHERCRHDEMLNHPFSHGVNADHVARLAAYWGEVFGGPPAFSERFGGHSAMLEMHARQGMDDDLGVRFTACFVAAADDAGLPADPELRAVLKSYMEWATAEVMSYDPPDSVVPEGLPAPRWSWDGLQ